MIKISENLRLRIISAAVLAPITMALISIGGVYFQIMILASAILMSFEWNSIINETGKAELTKKQKNRWVISGVLYISFPCISLLLLRDMENGLLIVLWLMLTVWATDIGAFAAGRTIGGPKLAPFISPNKTWAGLLGGMASAAILSFIFAQWIASPHSKELTIIGASLAVISQIGDFLESWIKRYFGVKDSGTTIPGHGGLLDRVDGIITVAPIVLFITLLRSDLFIW